MLSLSSADFFQNLLFQKIILGTLNSLYSNQDHHSFVPDLGPNCLQRLSADDKSRC